MNGCGLGTLVPTLDANAITELMQESHHSDGHHCEAVDAWGTLNEECGGKATKRRAGPVHYPAATSCRS
ncbi:hypothetical protein OR573_14835 [Halomonas sp. CH40]